MTYEKGGESARYNGHKHRKGVKAHAAVSSDSIPLAIIVGAGNEHDSRRFEQVVSSIRINIGRGRPRSRPREVLADAAYDTEAIRSYLRRRGIRCSIPSNNRNLKNPQNGRPTRFDEASYKKRGAVERFFGWLKTGFRRICMRHKRLDACFAGLILLASFLLIWRKM
jgi:transposase